MILTDSALRAGMKAGSGLTKAQAAILKIKFPARRGWIQRLIGKSISDLDYREFVALKGVKKGKRKKHTRKTEPPPEPVELPAKQWTSREQYLRSAEWRAFRETVLDFYGWKCEHCGDTNNIMVMRRDFFVPLWDAMIDQLQVACRRCADNIRKGRDPVEGKGSIDREYASIVKD